MSVIPPPSKRDGPDTRRQWQLLLLVVLAVTALRLIYLIAICPFELVADEAHYWDWSRRVSLSYYSKGPGVAWAIGASTSLFGHSEWAVRLPAAISGLVLMLASARLAMAGAVSPMRAAWFSVFAILCVPAYQAIAILMTIDGWYVALWAVSCWLAWEVWRRLHAGRNAVAAAVALAAALGIGFLFKYTIVLLLPGLLLFLVLRRRSLQNATSLLPLIALGSVIFALTISPVVLWNWQHDWPTVRHLLGHLGVAGGDIAPRHSDGWTWSPMWTLELIGSQIGMIGPMLILGGVVAWHCVTKRRRDGQLEDQDVFLMCCAAPILVFHLALSFMTDVEGNWPIAGYVTICVLVARSAGSELDRYRSQVQSWRADGAQDRRGLFRRKPETIFQVLWHWSVGYGAGAAVLLVILPLVASAPLVGRFVPVDRFAGQRALAEQIEGMRRDIEESSGRQTHVAAARYGQASLLAFYLPGQPVVFSAESSTGGRKSSYDFFRDTDLNRPDLTGDSFILIGATLSRWQRGMQFDRLTQVSESIPAYAGIDYAGMQSDDTKEQAP